MNRPETGKRSSFADLIAAEWKLIRPETSRGGETIAPEVSPDDEPRVTFCPNDTVGLCLSGGGIRSATFNLGLLQGLDSFRLLSLTDYVSSVSGGGYIGSWWSAWLCRKGKTSVTPQATDVFPEKGGKVEPPEVRHLREFSRFLAPRVGLFETEMWNAAVAYLSGLIPTFLLTLALCLTAWATLILVMYGVFGRPLVSALIIAAAFRLLQHLVEDRWRARGKGLACTDAVWSKLTLLAAVLLGLLYAAGLRGLYRLLGPLSESRSFELFVEFVIGGEDAPTAWCVAILYPAFLFLGSTLCYLALQWSWRRLLHAPSQGPPSAARRAFSAARDRLIGRLMLFAVCWTGIGLIWISGCLLYRVSTAGGVWPGIATWLASNALFIKLRNWMFRSLRPGQQAGWMDSLKPWIPMLLAYVALGSGLILSATAFVATIEAAGHLDYVVPSVALFGVPTCWLLLGAFDPERLGLHAFYRRRICRAFPGASNYGQGNFVDFNQDGTLRFVNRETDPLPHDDLLLQHLPGRPLHLVCCTANTLGVDGLATLFRGSRSFTASRCGLGMADAWLAATGERALPTYGNFLTASAAAFNSNMGSVSVKIGPAAAVLLSVANLRLGLWAPNPAAAKSWTDELPNGRHFLREMFSRTTTDKPLVHLSDGGHFENLGLYELVRRHCRYIIVSDCGADPETAFDDLGNALRRIREDFSVEIEIDVEPLRPTPEKGNLARQHVVVGTIHYDGVQGLDKGLLIYFKPNLTGDEPPDVAQYHTRNLAFPNESTVDQFYDEAQWEAYRRLGEHAAHAAFRFLEKPSRKQEPLAASKPEMRNAFDVFPKMRWEWYPTPVDLESRVVAQARELSRVFETLRSRSAAAVRKSLFPELDFLKSKLAYDTDSVVLVTELLQFMENTWQTCRLESLESHPLNKGWLNQFARWVVSPAFQKWWPFLKPLYSDGIVDYVEQRLGVSPGSDYFPSDWQTRICFSAAALPTGLTSQWYFQAMHRTPPADVDGWYVYEAKVPGEEEECAWLQVGLLGCRRPLGEQTLYWNWNNLIVAPGMNNAGVGTEFLRHLMNELPRSGPDAVEYLAVNMKPQDKAYQALARGAEEFFLGKAQGSPDPAVRPNELNDDTRTDPASRNRLVDEITFYKSLGFRWKYPGDVCLVRNLTSAAKTDGA